MIFPKTVKIVVILILLIETVFISVSNPITGYPFFEPTADNAVIEQKLFMANYESDITFIGDSSALFGISPSAMRTPESPSKILNLGTIASFGIAGYYELFKRHVNETAPKHVILALLPQTLELKEKAISKYRNYSDFLCATRNISYWVSKNIKNCTIWYRSKHQFNIFPTALGGSYARFSRNISESLGHLKETHEYTSPERIHTSFTPSDYSHIFLEKFFELAKQKNITLSVIFNPKPSSSITENYAQDAMNFLNTLSERYPDTSPIKGLPLVMDDKYFATETHLNEEGAQLHSKKIAKALGI